VRIAPDITSPEAGNGTHHPRQTANLLTDRERRVIAEARQLAALDGSDAIREHLTPAGIIKPSDGDEMVYPIAYGNARWLLGELAAIAERLGGAE